MPAGSADCPTPGMPYTACPGERRCSEPSPLVKARAQLSAGHRGPLPDHHRQDRTLPQDPASRAADRPPLRLPRPCPADPGRLGGRLQHPASPPSHRHASPSSTLPAADHRGDSSPDDPTTPVTHGGPDRDHPPSLGQRPHRGLLPAGLSRPPPRRPGRHRPAPPQRAPGLLRRPAHPHRPRTSTKEVVQLRAHQPHQPKQPKTT